MTKTVSGATRKHAGARREFTAAGVLVVLAVVVAIGTIVSIQGYWSEQKPARLTDVLSQTIKTKGTDAAIEQYRRLRDLGFPGLRESESGTNSLGYDLLRKEDTANAIRFFQLNMETHPKSSNVYDSLAEAYAAAGNKALAIENYEKALAINPKNKTALSVL